MTMVDSSPNSVKEEWKRFKQEVLSRIQDFSTLFQGVQGQHKNGSEWVTARCPFHDDHTPSFAFNNKTGQWACFAGCGKGGALDYLMHTTGASFRDALLALGDKTGVPRPHLNGSGPGEIRESYVRKMREALAQNKEIMSFLTGKRGLTEETIRRFELGWDSYRRRISIPIRDEHGALGNIRFYSSTQSPKMINLKGFGNPPRLYGADLLAKNPGKQVILCEGEFDRLLLEQNGFVAVTSTHGCTAFRKEWISLFEGKDLVIAYDVDPEGQAAVQGVVLRALKDAKVSSIRNLQLPLSGAKDDKDFGDFFTKERPVDGSLFDKRHGTAEDLKRLIAAVPLIESGSVPAVRTPGGPGLLDILNSIRDAKKVSSHQKLISVAEVVMEHLTEQGAFFFDPRASNEYLCLDGLLYTISNNRTFNALLQRIGRLNHTTSEGKFVWEFLKNAAREKGSPVRSAGWVCDDADLPAVYIHAHDEMGRILKITSDSIVLIPNGRNDDKVMLNPSDRVQPFRYLDNVDPAQGWALFKELLFDAFPCAEADKALLSSLVPLVFLKDFCPARPLIRLSGSSDSGKTTAAKLIGHLIYGEDIAKTGTIASFYTDASRNPLAMLDNLEVSNLKGELLDFLLTGATGIVHEKKKLYTDQEIVREKAASFIMTTGIESLGKPELLSRQWEIPCDAAFHNPRFSQGNAIQKILKHRDVILSAVFRLLSQQILPRIEKRYDVEMLLKREFKDHPKERTFECLALAFLVWDALEEPLGLEKNLWSSWLKSQQAESEETATDTNLVLQFLNLFKGAVRALESARDLATKDEFFAAYHLLPEHGEDGMFFTATAGGIFHLFTALAKRHGYPRPFENPRQLMARLRESLPLLKSAGWEVRISFKTVRGEHTHWVRIPENEPKEGGFPGGAE